MNSVARSFFTGCLLLKLVFASESSSNKLACQTLGRSSRLLASHVRPILSKEPNHWYHTHGFGPQSSKPVLYTDITKKRLCLNHKAQQMDILRVQLKQTGIRLWRDFKTMRPIEIHRIH